MSICIWENICHDGGVTSTSNDTSSKAALEQCCPDLFGSVLGVDEAEDLAVILKALADPVRLRLVNAIATAGEGCACDFPGLLDKSQPTISHHLSILVKAGILGREQRGKWAWFWVESDRLEQLRNTLRLS